MVLSSAMMFVPHAGKKAPTSAPHRETTPPALSKLAVYEPVGIVTTEERFWLPPEAFEGLIQEAAAKYDLPPALIRAVIRTESAFNPVAVSSAGALGLMQLMPALAAELGVTNAFDPWQNVMAGSRYLKALIGDRNGDVGLALASYNAGPATVDRYNGIPPYQETQQYVKTILDLMESEEPQR